MTWMPNATKHVYDPPPPPDEPGTILRRRMREVGLSQAAFGQAVKKSQGWISQYLFGDTQSTIKRLWATDPYTLTQVAKALEWSDHELIAHVGVAVPVQQPAVLSTETQFLDRYGDKAELTVNLPVWASLAAGIRGFEKHDEPDHWKSFDRRELPPGTDLAKLYLVKANGNSMFEENMTRPIPDGAYLMVEANAAPDNNQVVTAYIPELDIGVVKQFRNEGGNVLLRSYRIGGPTFWAEDYPEMKIEGVVRRVTFDL